MKSGSILCKIWRWKLVCICSCMSTGTGGMRVHVIFVMASLTKSGVCLVS